MPDPLPNRAKNNKKGKALRAGSPAKPMQNCMARLIGTLSQELTMEFEPCGRR